MTPLPKLSGNERDYLAAQEFETRVGIIYRVAKGNPGDAVQALGRLFSLEKDPELKALMLAALGDVEGEIEAKLTILQKGLMIEQAPDVRHAAAAELEWLADRRAIPLWQKLANDPDPEIRDFAGDIIHSRHAAQKEK